MSQQIPLNSEPEKNADSCELYLQAQKLKPHFSSHLAALASIQQELEKMAQSMGMTIESLTINAESSKTYNVAFLRAASLQRQIRFHKSQIK